MTQEEKKDEAKKEEKRVVLRVDMHCEACKNKVRKAIKGIPGVEKMEFDMNEQTVTITGKVDAKAVYEAVKRKCGRRTDLIYPEIKKEDLLIDSINKIMDSITDLFNPKPPDTIVELKVKMHCGGCAKQIKKSLMKMEGVMDVVQDVTNDKVTVKGRGLDAEKVCERVTRLGKHCEVVPLPAKKDEKGDGKKEDQTEKNDASSVKDDKKADSPKKKDTSSTKDKKEEKNSKGQKEEGKTNDDKNEETTVDTKSEAKKYVYPSYRSVPEYVYPPQLFSDENPNACVLM